MSKFIVKSLRDGCLEGDHAPALAIVDSLLSPLGSQAFQHFLASFLSLVKTSSSQARGLILVAFDQSPSFYLELFKSIGIDASMLEKWVRILDCYTDPLGWKHKDPQSESNTIITILNNINDNDKIFKSILDLTTGFGGDGKTRFAVSIDSISHMFRHSSLRSVSSLLINLRSHEKISCIFYLLHSDIHEPKCTSSLEYISTMIATIESIVHLPDNTISFNDQNYSKANFNARLKKRNGRVKLICEEMNVEHNGVKFNPIISSLDTVVTQNIIPKVQFNLDLSDKEKIDRANVILPFEHQGNGENVQIYDGRKSLLDNKKDEKMVHNNDGNSVKGEIHYFRDSDDERPDSDEDPDDDLDI